MSPENREPEDQDFEAFMAGRDEVSREYRKLDQPQSPQNVDDAVLRMARAAVAAPRARPAPVAAARPRRRWQVPLALAATVVLSLSALVALHEDEEAKQQAMLETGQTLNVPMEHDAAPASALDEVVVTAMMKAERRQAPAAEAPAPAAPEPMPSPPPPPKPEPMKPAAPSISADAQMSGQLAQLRASEAAAQRQEEDKAKKEDMQQSMAAERRRQAYAYAQDQQAPVSSGGNSMSKQYGSRMAPGAASPVPMPAPAAPPRATMGKSAAQPHARLDSDGDGVPDFKDEAEEAAAMAAQRPPAPPTILEKMALVGAEEWIALIRKLRDQPNLPEARRELENFRRTFPDYPLPEDLKPLLPQPDGAGK